MLCYGTAAGTYTFAYADAQNPIVCETNQRAYQAVFTKEDNSNPIANTWNLTRWRVSFNNGRLFYACAYSIETAGIYAWSVSESKAVNLYRNATNSNTNYPLALFNDCTNGFACGYVSCGCQATFNPSTGVLSAKCFVGDDQYHAVIPNPYGNTSSYYATIVLDSTCANAETSMVFNSYTSEYHLLTWFNGTSCLNEIKELWYVDSKYSIDSVGVSTCKANTDCIYIKYCGYRPTVVNSSRKIKCIVYGCTTAPSNVTWTAALKGIFCSRNTTCFGGCTYADACTNIRNGLISDIALNVYCDTTCKCTLNKNSSLCLCANAFNENAQISTTTYPGACCTGTLVPSDLNDYQKKNIATGITINNTSNLTCVNTILSCFNNTAPRKAYYIYFGAAHCRYTYLGKIPFGSGSGTGYVSLDMTLYNQSPVGNEFPIRTIHIDMSAGGSSSAFSITGWTDARLDSACTCHPRIVVTKDTSTSFYCLYLDSTYAYVNARIYLNQERSFTVGDLCAYNAVSGTEVFNSTTCDSIKYIGGLVSIADKAAANESTPILLCTGPTSVGKSSSCSLTFNTCTGVFSTMGTCIGYNRTASCCIEVTPAAQSSCWIYIGAFQPNGTGTGTKQYNELSLAFAAIGNGMVSQANVRINAGSALCPVVSIQRGAVYSADTGIDSVVVTRSGSVWSCYLCVWARVKSYGTNKYYFHLFRNMLPDGWLTSLAICSAYTGTVVAINNATSSTSDGRTQMNVPLVIGNYQTCTSSTAGCAGSLLEKGGIELLGTTPYIDFHRNNYCGDYSARIINDNDRLTLTINNGSGCTASTASSSFYFCSNGNAILPASIIGSSGRLLNCIFSKADNSGYPTYRLLYDVTDWYNAAGTSSSNVAGRGLVGTFTHFRCLGYTNTGATQVTAVVAYGKGSQADACCITNVINLTYADIGYPGVSTIPYILKDSTNSKYYIAIRTTSSGHNYIFSGCAYSSSGTGFTVNCEICATDANGTLPSGWSITTTGVRCQRANGVYVSCNSGNTTYPLLMGSSENAWATIYSNCSKFKANPNTGRLIVCQSRVNDYILVGNTETGAAGTINPTEGGILLCKSQSGKMIQLNGNIGTDIGLLLYHCGDLSGNSYCTLGIEIGAGNVNRGFYHFCAGTFQWLQHWDASKEIHNCPVCFNQCVNGSSSFAGTTAMFNNTNRLGSVYSSSSYNTGYYLLAQICDNGSAGNHDIVLGGYLDGGIYPRMTWKGLIRANKCTFLSACFWVNNALASNCLVATREIDTTTCKLILRVYGKVSANYQRFNTTITYAAIGDINARVSPYCSLVTLPGTYVTSVTGTVITATKNIGAISVDNITICNASSLTCSFPATSSTYILLGCYSPLNNTLANEIDLGFAIGGGNLVSNTNLKLMLTNAGCCSTSQFLQNNIEIKSTNFGASCYGPRCILFTSSGSGWNCKIGIWAVVCNPASSTCFWCFGLLRNRTDDRFSTCLCCQSTAPTGIVCTIDMGTLRNFYFNNARESCFSGILSTSILCTGSFIPLPTIICGNCNQCYIHLGCYKPDLLCANEVDLTLTVGDAGNNSVNIKALLTTGCINEFYKNNITVNTASVDRSHAYIDSVVFTTIGTCWSCSIDIYAVVCSTAACTCYSLYNNKQNACFKKCFEVLAGLPPDPLKCSIPVNGDSITALSAPLLASTWKMETNASASFALGCNSYTTLVIGGVNDVRSPTYQKLFISTCITGSENPLNMWIDYMGGYGDKDFITACYSGANCNVIVPMRISSDFQNIYIDLATCTCAARDLCATIYSSSPMPLGSCGNSIRTTCYTACFIDASCAYVYVMCQWPTTITLNVDDPASQFATRILSANTISAYCMATTSDIRQKKDIVPYNNGLCDISKLDVISFRYKNEDSSCIKHVSIPANWTNPLLSGEKQNQLRINDAVGILLGAVKDLSKSMTLGQKIKLWLYKKFIEPKNNKKIQKKLEDFN